MTVADSHCFQAMMSTQQTRTLLDYAPRVPTRDKEPSQKISPLYDALSKLSTLPPTVDNLLDALDTIQARTSSLQGEESDHDLDLVGAILTKVSLGVYGQTVDQLLRQALDAENEAEWWGHVERSKWRSAYFLLQSTFRSALCKSPS